eukprot:14967603-Alexandrium_andersonii.AAC.1
MPRVHQSHAACCRDMLFSEAEFGNTTTPQPFGAWGLGVPQCHARRAARPQLCAACALCAVVCLCAAECAE